MNSDLKQIGQRALFILFLGHAGVALCATMLGIDLFIANSSLLLLGFGLAGLAATRFFYDYGCTHYDFAKLDNALGVVGSPSSAETSDPVLNRHIDQLRQLEDSLAEMRQHDREIDFNPWELQEQRHKISSLLRADPRLQEFARGDIESNV